MAEKKGIEDAVAELDGAEVVELEDSDMEDVAGGVAAVNKNNTQCCNSGTSGEVL